MTAVLGLIWLIALLAVPVTMAYRRVGLLPATVIIGAALLVYSLYAPAWLLWLMLLWILWGGLLALNLTQLRREKLTAKLFALYKTMVPTISSTEREALEAGSVSWDGELFTGRPDWNHLLSKPAPQLSEEEQAFLDEGGFAG